MKALDINIRKVFASNSKETVEIEIITKKGRFMQAYPLEQVRVNTK